MHSPPRLGLIVPRRERAGPPGRAFATNSKSVRRFSGEGAVTKMLLYPSASAPATARPSACRAHTRAGTKARAATHRCSRRVALSTAGQRWGLLPGRPSCPCRAPSALTAVPERRLPLLSTRLPLNNREPSMTGSWRRGDVRVHALTPRWRAHRGLAAPARGGERDGGAQRALAGGVQEGHHPARLVQRARRRHQRPRRLWRAVRPRQVDGLAPGPGPARHWARPTSC